MATTARFSHPDDQPDQDSNGNDGDHHVQEEFVRFLFRRLSVIARDRELNSGGDDAALGQFHFFQDLAGDFDGVGSLSFRDRKGDRVFRLPGSGRDPFGCGHWPGRRTHNRPLPQAINDLGEIRR
jgi:hypothetical protein